MLTLTLAKQALRDLRVVGQIGFGYILVDELLAAWIVDQHVAHERALLDKLADPEDGQMPTIQSLLVPEVVQLPPKMQPRRPIP